MIWYKCYSHIPDITPEIFYKVALDIEYRLIWDKYLKGNNDGIISLFNITHFRSKRNQ